MLARSKNNAPDGLIKRNLKEKNGRVHAFLTLIAKFMMTICTVALQRQFVKQEIKLIQ